MTTIPLHRALRGAVATAAVACLLVLAAAPAPGQVNVSGQASAAFINSGDAHTQYAVNNGRPTFAWRADLFFDAEITDDIVFLSNLRMTQAQRLRVDLFALRFTGFAGSYLNAEAGLIDVPFGNLGDRRFPKTNPFISLPFGREHLTSLRSSEYTLWMSDGSYTAAGDGVPVIDGALYDAGVKLYGTAGILDYAVAVINGSISSTYSYAEGGYNDNGGLSVSGRVAITPATGLTIGLSAATGQFMSDDAVAYYGGVATTPPDPADHLQRIAALDFEYAYGHFTMYAEGFFNRWEFSEKYGTDLDAAGVSAELRYVPAARFSLAARIGTIAFNELPGAGDPGYAGTIPGATWDHNVLRLEGAAGYRFTREVLLKAVYQHVTTYGLPTDPYDDSAALQIVASF
jgi:hypothetical protein